jgi:hypothetical protein
MAINVSMPSLPCKQTLSNSYAKSLVCVKVS